uniref:Alpha-1,3/1,6-mannosyltransferase ALG2 n=1 Tax=Solanum tuberosum TaxID=4113 RepID=M1CZS4_SOLTU
MEKKGSSKMNIAIIHPDLGIGGAERLIVDAAMELASLGHKVHIFTSHHDKNRCFEETLSGVFDITVYGAFLPRHIFYRLHAVCAYLRCMFVALCLLFMWPSFDVILADQVSVVVPILKLKKSAKVVFYCHFPDLLLAQRTTILRRIYRKPIDFIEEITTGMADLILVNSRFTASTFASTFKNLDACGIKPAVLYPAVNVDQFEKPDAIKLNFLSINRFERKKNIELAISAFAMVHAHEVHDHQGVNMNDVSLTVAGKFLQFFNFNDEHFGIVPLEAMAAYKPVIACNSGGPVETVKHGVTGFLCDPSPREFASAMSNFIQDPHMSEKMGQDARQHVAESFSTKIFGQHLNRYLVDIARGKKE